MIKVEYTVGRDESSNCVQFRYVMEDGRYVKHEQILEKINEVAPDMPTPEKMLESIASAYIWIKQIRESGDAGYWPEDETEKHLRSILEKTGRLKPKE